MNVKLTVGIAGVVACLAVAATSLDAHHAFAAEFDAQKPVAFAGTITGVEWINPHVWLHMDIQGPGGKVENWGFEAGTPSVLFRRGFTKASLVPGTKVHVDGYQAKDGSTRAVGKNVTFADGKRLFLGLMESDAEKKK